MSENGIMTIADFTIESMNEETRSAIDLHNNIISAEQSAATAMLALCENLKKMRDSHLYKSLGFEDFESYTEQACNIKKRQAYNYIQTYERLGSQFLQSNAQLGITKLKLLTEVCAVDRAEFAEGNDLEGMSVAEIKKLVEENKSRGEQISILEVENKELRNRPVEVAVQEPSAAEIEKAADKKIESLKAEYEAKQKQLEAESKEKIKKAKEKAEAKASKDNQKAIDEAVSAAKKEVKSKYQSEIDKANAERAEALKRAEDIAAKLDKNADADLVKASLYFGEAQKQLKEFAVAAEKVTDSDPEKGFKLKSLAANYLSKIIENLSKRVESEVSE